MMKENKIEAVKVEESKKQHSVKTPITAPVVKNNIKLSPDTIESEDVHGYGTESSDDAQQVFIEKQISLKKIKF